MSAYLNAFAHAQQFETEWACYSLSDGALRGEDCKKTAGALTQEIAALLASEPDIRESFRRRGVVADIDEINQRIARWASGTELWPYEDSFHSSFHINALVNTLKFILGQRLGVSLPLHGTLNSEEDLFRDSISAWKEHLSADVLRRATLSCGLLDLIERGSCSHSIVVLADIRSSQELMEHAPSPAFFAERLCRFLDKSRELIWKYQGIFDKFTGDGFLAYFNDTICSTQRSDFVDSAIAFLREEASFSQALFDEWSKHSSIPSELKIGLGIGATLGTVAFQKQARHLVAVAKPIVWAARFAGAAAADEILVSRDLDKAIGDRPGVHLEAVTRTVKRYQVEGSILRFQAS